MSEAVRAVGGDAATGRPRRSPGTGPGGDSSATHLIHRIMRASKDLHPIGLQAELDSAATALGLTRCVDQIVVPASRLVREKGSAGQLDAAQELTATEAIRTWLCLRGSFAPPPREIGPILFACGPHDLDMVGPESLALLLRFRRWPCWVLGARIPTFTLTIAAQAADAIGVIVFCAGRRGRSLAIDSVRAVDALGIPVFFAGSGFQTRRSRRRLPGRYLGTRMGAACDLLIDTLAAAP